MKTTKRIYISGPMSGVPREQYLEMFRRAEQSLRSNGYTKVVNPIRVWVCRWPWLYRIVGYRLTLLYDLWLLTRCDLIYKLPGWRDSRGANIESCVAYHFKIWSVPFSQTKKLDKNWRNSKINGTKNRMNNEKTITICCGGHRCHRLHHDEVRHGAGDS